METWLVTGSLGFLGTNAGGFLRRRVNLVGQARVGAESALYERIVGLDLRNPTQMTDLIAEVRPYVVLNAAAISRHETSANDPEQAYAVNVVATKAIAEACAEVAAQMVHISTDVLFAGDRGNYTEGDEPAPFSYGDPAVLAIPGLSTLQPHMLLEYNVVERDHFPWLLSGWITMIVALRGPWSRQHVCGGVSERKDADREEALSP